MDFLDNSFLDKKLGVLFHNNLTFNTVVFEAERFLIVAELGCCLSGGIPVGGAIFVGVVRRDLERCSHTLSP